MNGYYYFRWENSRCHMSRYIINQFIYQEVDLSP